MGPLHSVSDYAVQMVKKMQNEVRTSSEFVPRTLLTLIPRIA